MTPKQKAKELVERFKAKVEFEIMPESTNMFNAKECALICVDEIEKYRKVLEDEYDEYFYYAYNQEEYWQEVKQEINKL